VIDQDSTEFVEAFVSAARPGEPRGRPGWWMAMIAVSVVFAVALASLLNGALSGGGSAQAAGTWTAVAGPSCTSDGTSFMKVGYYTGAARKSADWTTSATGGYSSGGCTGGFVSVPMSGNIAAYHSNRYALWTFDLNATLSRGASCRLSTYVPDVTTRSAVGGAPAHYYYYETAYVPGLPVKPAGTYAVNQVANLGHWVVNRSFSVTGGHVSVRMVDAGASRVARDAAAQVRLSCSAT
jgi:hypothetical protein